MGTWKKIAKNIFRVLPYPLQVRLARGNPEAAFYISKKPRIVEINYYLNKYKVRIHTDVDIERRMLSGSYESDSMNVFRKLVRPGHVCLDIGANVGAISLALADMVGAHGCVESFEPGPIFFDRLSYNLQLNPQLQKIIRTHPIGLANKAGRLAWQASKVYTGTASMYPGVFDKNSSTLELPVVRLDEYPPILEHKKIDFIKIDVDGLELEILEGAQNIIARHRPFLYFETTLHDDAQKLAARKIDFYLRGLDYNLYKILTKSYQLQETRYPDFSVNTVAIPMEV